jgi:hypothetical protein
MRFIFICFALFYLFVFNNLSAISKKISPIKVEKKLSIGSEDLDSDNYFFGLISDIKLDKFGNIYILDDKNFRAQKFSKDGKFLLNYGRKGAGPGELLGPKLIFVDDDCNLYITDRIMRGINIYAPDGKFIKLIKLSFTPYDIVVSKKNGIFLTSLIDFGKYKIYNINISNGKIINKFGNAKKTSTKVAKYGGGGALSLGKDGNIYYTFIYPYEIHKYSPEGKLLKILVKDFEKFQDPETDKLGVVDIPSISISIKSLSDGNIINLIRLKKKTYIIIILIFLIRMENL